MIEHEIRLLSRETIDKIAAGEVVERPASCVKELVENAIDAGASAITVEIKEGGTTFIRVSDDGCGIKKEQIPLAFLRHSTSKIQKAEDLVAIHSLGFRGEALSSMAAVSRMEMITKTTDSLTGYHYCIEGAREVFFNEIGAPDGTSIIIRELFFNTPARRKFLKSPVTEGNYIQEILEHLALSHPAISFRLLSNGQEKVVTSGSDNLKEAIYQVYGREIASALIPFAWEDSFVKIQGFLGDSVINRGNRNFENFYVQGRFVKSKLLSLAVEEGYRGYLMQHQYPFVVLFFTFSDAMVDVNVHPTKMEVRFENSAHLAEILENSIHERLIHREDIREEKITEEENKKAQPSLKKEQIGAEPFEKKSIQKMQKTIAASFMTDLSSTEDENLPDDSMDVLKENSLYQAKESQAQAEEEIQPPAKKIQYEQSRLPFLSEEAKKSYQILGQIFDTYWIVEFNDKMYIIDQHAAHEKVLFERTMKKLKEKTMTSQQISPAMILSLSQSEQEILERYRDAFFSLGFSFEPFGGKEYQITAVPANLFNIDARQFFLDALSSLADFKKTDTNELILEKVASMSCKAAVKGHMKLSLDEAKALIDELLSLDNPYHCPHGRPTIISMSHYELDKKFKRIV